MRRKLLFMLSVLIPAVGWTQTPVKVALCDLVKNPQQYSRQWVEVRGQVELAFENFSLNTHDCGERQRGIWLAYGSDETTPKSPRKDAKSTSGSVLTLPRPPVTLVKDANLDLFKRRLDAQRTTFPDGSPCSDCLLYRVTATLIGLFMAVPETSSNTFAGYGHMGCCHLLTIRQVTDVTAARTMIPAGGKFSCSTDTWDMDASEAKKVVNYTCHTPSDCLQPFHILVQHWHDDIDLNNVGGFDGSAWLSADLLTSYRVAQKLHKRDLVGATAKRTVCTAIEAPYPQDTAIGCRDLFSDFSAKKHTEQQPAWEGEPDAIAIVALEEAARRWNIQLRPGIAVIKCDQPNTLDGEQMVDCKLAEPTSMQSFTVRLSRKQFLHQLRSWKNAPWKLASAYGVACNAEESN